ncbi:SnoaL-like protein [Sinobacterium caligoides]|uniref:SnoaL-like protein n=1 Tax=Sinobacterium caligoides TaxID=933926 RepID=A0A3N2DNC0_9GAMM|nr:nuclear transport factor 2 family protein [Sinobacterium caligoides]ROS01303.1 SnoaL-like protein [Sinobacterium caligoides]
MKILPLLLVSCLLSLAACDPVDNEKKAAPYSLNAEQIIAAVDSGDPNLYAKLLTDNSVFRFANYPPVKGKPDIFSAQSDFYASVKSTKHEIIRVWQDNETIVADMLVTYVRHDGSTITLPVVDIFEIEDNKISATLIYMDINPLHASD